MHQRTSREELLSDYAVCIVGDKEMVSYLLENFPETAHISNSNGDQVVHFAAAEGMVWH